ncbi:MAG: hypothetical protein CME06_01450 [Gemmatimonadetes bacterium]|nr:hypothetical protein [Gemmatimonadota bacterium]
MHQASLPKETGRSAPERVAGLYSLRTELGSGAEGVVYRVRHEVSGEEFALKRPHEGAAGARASFKWQFRHLAEVRHPNVAKVEDFGFDENGEPFFTMEILDAEPLRSGRLSGGLGDALQVAAQVADALDALHGAGLVHGDLKPDNILQTRDSNPRVVLADLGLARPHGVASRLCGTPDYMAPEIALGRFSDGRADFYSLGVALFEWVAGHRPFVGESVPEVIRLHVEEEAPRLSSVAKEVPKVLDELVARLLEKDPDARVRSGRQVIDALRASATAAGLEGAVTPAGLLMGAFRARESDLRYLRRAWARARRHSSIRVAGLIGPAGCGKSRLLDELEWRARLSGAWVGRANCDPDDPEVYSPLAGAIAAIAARLPLPMVDGWARQFPGTAALGFGEVAGQPEPVQVYEALVELFARSPRPVLMIVDHAEQGSAETVEVLAALAEAGGDARAMVVFARGKLRRNERRAERDPRTPDNDGMRYPPRGAWKRVEEAAGLVELSDLPSEEIESIAKAMLGAERLSRSFGELLALEVRGRPGRLKRLLSGLMATGALHRSAGAWTAEVEEVAWYAEGIALDDGENEAIAAMVERLDPLERRALLCCATVRQGDIELLAELLGQAPSRARQVAESLERSGALRVDADGRFQVRSRELSEAILNQNAGEEVRDVRARAALALAAAEQCDPLQVARLALGGCELQLASIWVDRALEGLGSTSSRAAQRALIEGLIGLQIAEDAGPEERAETLWRAIDLIDGQGDHAGAAALAEDLLSLADELPVGADPDLHRAYGWRWVAHAHYSLGTGDRGEAALEKGIEALGEKPADEPASHGDERVHLLHLRGLILMAAGRFDDAAALLESVERDLAPHTLDPELHTARLKGTLAGLASRLGRPEDAAGYASEALTYHERVGDFTRAAASYNVYGMLAYQRNAWKVMSSNFRKALANAERAGDLANALRAMSNVAYAEAEGGSWDEALATTRRGRLLCERIGDDAQRVGFLNTAGLILLWRGDLGAAEEEFGAGLDLGRRCGYRESVPVTLGNLGDCALERGDLDSACKQFEEALEGSREFGLRDAELENTRRLAETHLRLGDLGRAWRLGRDAAREARENEAPYETAQLYRLVGLYHETEGRHRRASAAYGRSLRILDHLGRAYEGARVRFRMGTAVFRGGDRGTGRREIEQAEQVFKRFGARRELAELNDTRLALEQEADGAGGRAFRKMEILLEASRAINGAPDIDELVGSVIDGAVEVSEAERGFLVTRDLEGDFHFQVARRRDGAGAPIGDVSRSALRRAFDEGQPSVITDVSSAEGIRSVATDPTRSMLSLELKSIMCVPLLVKETIVGAMYVDNRCSPATSFNDEDLKLLESLASIAATAMERARLYSRLMANYKSLERSKLAIEQAFTRLNETREGLLQAQKIGSMGQLAAGIAHELKQPLTAIIGRLDLLALETLSERGTRNLDVLTSQALRMKKLVQSMNGYVRQSTGEKEALDPCTPVHEALALLGERVRTARVEVSLDLDEGAALVRGDESQLQQVMINLITNAVDAMEEREERRLRIETTVDVSVCRLRVSDSGAGIPASRIHKIYELFETSKPKGKGTGLGLAIVRGIVEEHGGSIRVESTPDEGTAFEIELPLMNRED